MLTTGFLKKKVWLTSIHEVKNDVTINSVPTRKFYVTYNDQNSRKFPVRTFPTDISKLLIGKSKSGPLRRYNIDKQDQSFHVKK